ncbi:hypothetical protein ACLESO_01485 [Pyxidicoccus sp. 3LG]
MFAKRMLKRSTLLVVGFASLALSGCSAAPAVSENDGAVGAVALVSESQEESSVAACRPSCYGPCWSCIQGVCENTCM